MADEKLHICEENGTAITDRELLERIESMASFGEAIADDYFEKGIEKEKIATVKRMAKKNMPVALIAECTALSVEKVQKILKENGQLKRDSQIISGSFLIFPKFSTKDFGQPKKRKRLLHPFLKIMFEIMFAFFKSNSSFPVDNVHFFCHFSKLSFQGLMPIMFIFFRFSNINDLLVQHIAFY